MGNSFDSIDNSSDRIDNSFDRMDNSFENDVLKGLKKCGVKIEAFREGRCCLGVAVSGGADSISLLYSLAHILGKAKLPSCPLLHVITVNHFIRPKEETCGDADFVVDFCKQLKHSGFNVECSVVPFNPGDVASAAEERRAGVEEAARYLRYNAFNQFIKEKGIDFLCLAHNKNDHLETILMRFLQGSNVDGNSGIKISRDKFIRPLLNISRGEIENYLISNNLSWREDKTNNDTNYFRNNIRHNLIPLLNEKFSGWEKAIMAGGEKAGEDSEIINKIVNKFTVTVEYGNKKKLENTKTLESITEDWENCSRCEITKISFNKNDFLFEMPGVEKRILAKVANLLGENTRIPHVFLSDVIFAMKNANGDFSKVFNSIEIVVKKHMVFVKKYYKKDTDLSFFDIIEESGNYDFPFGIMSVTFVDSNVYVSVNGCDSAINCDFPICVRSAVVGDEIKSGNGNMKKVSDIFSDWHVCNSHKKLIPVIYNLKEGADNLKCVLGKFLGYKDWIVK